MIYFSELKGKEICTEDDIKVGVLEDLIFLASEKPNITKLVIRDLPNSKLIIPVSYLRKINSVISIKKDYHTVELEENELYLVKNMLDKQIIDLQGNKIVRVNDIAIQDKDGFYIAGVDIGILGILRWLKLENIFTKIISALHLKATSSFLSWADIQPLELTRGQVRLRKEEKKLEKLHPEDLADYLEKTNIINTKKILKMLDEKFAVEVISKLNISFQSALFKQFSTEKAVKVVKLIDPDDAVDILLTIPTKKREQIVSLLSTEKIKEINHLLALSRIPIGSLITTEFLTVLPENTVREVIDKVKKGTSDFFSLINIYVVNKDNQLIGVFNIHELLLQVSDRAVYKFMTQNVIVVHLTTPVEIAMRKMFKYKLVHLPVIDDEKRLQGIISIADTGNYFLQKINHG
ncbi:hypothetical protein A3A46_00740 [Candidatus Roizmanbacteria bacterium RIFCSPLOWO2_01_FULL_37_13]|nr:MAG: hypothetical protein A3F58_03040 [Candidatus Roizmanbacteria bacterium RIFCSPHIGHO2_12_FULL_37_9b]OGK41753.1 MAG: hypothetical protein A3A46_00740 [Candidatus Roizmanbacteria bacterium RIFCSPLOWO2_01_FULL_37_13]